MPTDEENVQYLYLVLTHGGAPTIHWDAVGTAMDLKKGAVSKRWSRLKKSMEQGETPPAIGSVYEFLWLCIKHCSREGRVFKWDEIAKKCGTTSGAASKRYSRMKQAFEAGDIASRSNHGSPAPKTPSMATPRKKKAATLNADESDEATATATSTPKRKRASPNQKEVTVKPEPEPENEDRDTAAVMSEEDKKVTPKKAKVTPKFDANGKSPVKKGENINVLSMQPTLAIKNEVAEDGIMDSADETFVTAEEYIDDDRLIRKEEHEERATRVDDWLHKTV